jgi:thymidylate synthase (FAD)
MTTKPTVELLHFTPLVIASDGARTCWDSHEKSDNGGPVDCALLDRIGNKFKHQSVLEHVSYNFYISTISRALLQELARHRMASYSVKSTRYTLKELKEEKSFDLSTWNEETGEVESIYNWPRAEKYIVLTGESMVDKMSYKALENLRIVLQKGISNDKAKYCLPESYKTELTWTINMRSLQNFLSLRTDKSALWEIQNLAHAVFEALPEEHKYMFIDSVKNPE